MFCYPKGLVVGLLATTLLATTHTAAAIDFSYPQAPFGSVSKAGFTAWHPLELLENSLHELEDPPPATFQEPSPPVPLLAPQPVPEPYAYIMAAFGLIGLLGMGTMVRRRKGIPARAQPAPAALKKVSEGPYGIRSRNTKRKTVNS